MQQLHGTWQTLEVQRPGPGFTWTPVATTPGPDHSAVASILLRLPSAPSTVAAACACTLSMGDRPFDLEMACSASSAACLAIFSSSEAAQVHVPPLRAGSRVFAMLSLHTSKVRALPSHLAEPVQQSCLHGTARLTRGRCSAWNRTADSRCHGTGCESQCDHRGHHM